ncbi:MAG: M20/M25/M40 family metallo-hydrolase, partial [Caldilineaceae bacterium]|nr:M20/M25/M40 family metallo-hydrolase [Caldilineaceae bacterium]
MEPSQLIPFYEQQQAQILETIGEHVEEETPTDDKGRLDAFAARLADRYTAAGLHTEVIPNQLRGNHLRALFQAEAHVDQPNAEPVLILCHYDTVWPVGSLDTHPFRVDEQGWAYGPGIFDMQSSLALVEYVMRGVRSLNLRLPRPVTVLVTSDEEVGSQTSRELIEEEARLAAFVL